MAVPSPIASELSVAQGSNAPQLPGCSSGFALVQGKRMAYHRAGSGSAAIFIHGLLGCAFSWRKNVLPLSSRRTGFAVDMIGAGASERSRDLDCSLRAHGQRLLEFMDVMGLDSADLIGNSHGCAIAMMAAALAIESGRPRVRSFVLANPVHPWARYHWMQNLLIASPLLRSLVAPALFNSRWLQSRFLRRLYGDTTKIERGTFEGYVWPLALPGSMEYVRAIVDSWREDLQQLEGRMSSLSAIPALIFWGGKDRAVRVDSSPRLHQEFHESRVVTLKEAGHLPMEEDSDRFNHEVSRFWDDFDRKQV